jgi:predicted DNA-binding protein (MmcQ/YjbR family)
MGLIREPEGVDFVIEPHNVTEEDHLAMLAFISVCKDRKAEQELIINKIKRSFKQVTAALY